jgi:hypothetical protein
MRKKLIALSFALAAAATALGVFAPKPAEAAGTCTFRVCCPGVPTCYCCPHPCSIQCP